MELVLDQPPQEVKGGMSGIGEIATDSKQNAIAISHECLKRRSDGQYEIIKESKAGGSGQSQVPVTVELGIRTEDEVEIVSGIEPGERCLKNDPVPAENST